MKNFLLVFLLVLTSSCGQNQTGYDGFESTAHNSGITGLQGKWRVSSLITNAATKEYTLSPQSPKREENYGYNVSLNADQTFVSAYSAECGNDCFTTVNGKYKIIDENYICFYVEKISRSGDCSGVSEPNEDLGMYYYKKFGTHYRLTKSTGNLKKDQEDTLHWDLIEYAYEQQWRYINLLTYKKVAQLSTDDEIVSFCLKENKITDYKLVASRWYDNNLKKIFLIEVDGKFRSIIYDVRDRKVALYDDAIIEKVDKLVALIKAEALPLKGVVSKEVYNRFTNNLNKNTIETYKKDHAVVKIVNNFFFDNGVKGTTTFYVKDNIPVFAEELLDFKYYVQKTEFYIVNWQDPLDTSMIIKLGNSGGGSGASNIRQQFERIIKNK